MKTVEGKWDGVFTVKSHGDSIRIRVDDGTGQPFSLVEFTYEQAKELQSAIEEALTSGAKE